MEMTDTMKKTAGNQTQSNATDNVSSLEAELLTSDSGIKESDLIGREIEVNLLINEEKAYWFFDQDAGIWYLRADPSWSGQLN